MPRETEIFNRIVVGVVDAIEDAAGGVDLDSAAVLVLAETIVRYVMQQLMNAASAQAKTGPGGPIH